LLDSIAPGLIDPEPFSIRTIFKRLERVGYLFAKRSKDRQRHQSIL